jgi:glycosyltransferase involved in cell wall biosynthesis
VREADQALSDQGLELRLESPLPPSLPVGRATAVFCSGICWHRSDRVVDLRIVVDGVRHRPAAFAMPRPDTAASGEPLSGFWGTVPIPAHPRPGAVRLDAAVRLATGAERTARLGEIAVVDAQQLADAGARPDRDGPGLIAICMGTYDPDPELFQRQIESLRSQSDRRWICLISDDCSTPERFEHIERTIAGDRRFAISRSERRLGFYRNFERALAMLPAAAEMVALCDQDDRWYPEKLELLRAALGGAEMVYSDQRLVDGEGRVLRETLWTGRRNNHTNLASLLVANTITGAATLFRREVAECAMPFPDTPGLQFHDHWLGLVALATGDIAYLERPLYDYVQHAGAVFAEVREDNPGTARRSGRLREVLQRWRVAYFYGYLGRDMQAQVLLARCWEQLGTRKRRALRLFVASDRSLLALGWLCARPLRALVRLNETLGSEAELAQGLLWRRLVALRSRLPRWTGIAPTDARFPRVGPESFEQRRLRAWRSRLIRSCDGR